MECFPLGIVAVPTPGTAVAAVPGGPPVVAAFTIQAVQTMTGFLIVKDGANVVSQLAPGDTWQAEETGGNTVATSGFALDASTGATNAAGIVTTWIA